VIKVDGKKYYQTNEACIIAGITKNTFLRWVAKGVLGDVAQRDRRGWRLFTREDIERLKAEANKVQIKTSVKNMTLS
jgi:DNA-binding transcriptional MerR regulator